MELRNSSKKELLEECKKRNYKNYISKNKEDLVKLLSEINISNTSNVSPLRYPGGKTRACKIIDKVLNEHFDITSFSKLASPFLGGGSFEFYCQNKYNLRLIVNDKFTPLYNFWNQVKINKNILCEELRNVPMITKDMFKTFRNGIMDLNDNVLEQAKLYFIINRCSFSGSTLSGGFSEEASKKRFTRSSIDRIESLDFADIEIYNYDYVDFLDIYIDDKTLIFLDPPYYLESNSNLYGKNGDMHENFDHNVLFESLRTKENWILTYNNCDFIRELYKDYLIIDVNWSYGMNKTKKSSEIIIISKLL